jgi:hypothetical protein
MAIRSATSVRRFHPDLKIALFTDDPGRSDVPELSIFDDVRGVAEKHERNKFDAMIGTPYDRTLYLDNDTMVKEGVVEDLFRILDRFDMALAHAPLTRIVTPLEGIPKSFPELNGGVVLFRKSAAVMQLLREWENNWKNNSIATLLGRRDQPYLRKLIWESDLRIAILPPEYNVRHARAAKILYSSQERIVILSQCATRIA